MLSAANAKTQCWAILVPIFMLVIYLSVVGCDSQNNSKKIVDVEKENTQLRQRISELENKIDELSNNATNMLAEANKYLEQKRWNEAIEKAKILKQRYPLVPEASQANHVISTATNELAAEKKRADELKEKLEKDKKDKEKRQNEALRGLDKNYDKVREISWYTPKSGGGYGNSLFLYIGAEKGHAPWLRFKIRYCGDWWLFINNVDIKIDDRPSYKYFPQDEIHHDNGSGLVWEIIDDPFNPATEAVVEAIIKSNSTIIRFNGRDNKIRDFTVTKQMKDDLRRVLDAYASFK